MTETIETMKIVELCRSNSIGSRYFAPCIIEQRTVSSEEAHRLLTNGGDTKMVNGYYWRELQEDRTGN